MTSTEAIVLDRMLEDFAHAEMRNSSRRKIILRWNAGLGAGMTRICQRQSGKGKMPPPRSWTHFERLGSEV